MNTILKVGAASALTLGAVAAHASISSPNSGTSDAILFAEVINAAGTAGIADYAGDTGVSINTILASNGSGTYLGTDANLAKLFAADNTAAGDTIEWALLGGQYTGGATTTNFKNPGVAQFLTTTAGNGTANLAKDTTGSLTHFAGINTDVSNINSNSGGANSVEGSNPATSGVWDYTQPLGLTFWDGGSTFNANLLGTTANLFYVTGGPKLSPVAPVTYSQVGTASLSAAGVTISQGSTNAVPLPAAVWLFGSGLLGLTGIARRKAKV